MQRFPRFNRPRLRGNASSALLGYADGDSPTLNLDFTTGVLDPRLTFTRSTVGTYYRGQFNQNLVTQSETFSTWTQFLNVSNNPSSEPSPSGIGTSRVIQDDSTNASHRLLANNVSYVAGQTYTQSVYAKAGTGTAIQLLFGSTEFGVDEWATFNLSNGTIGSVGTGVTGSDAVIQAVGNGWYRCSLTSPCTTSGTNVAVAINLTNSQSTTTRAPSYVGSGQTVFIWGAQLTEGSLLTPYIPTTTAAITEGQIASSQPWNLLLHSQAFDNANWVNTIGGTGVNPVRTANNAVAPDGTMTADTITFNAGAGTTSSDFSFITQTPVNFITGIGYTGSVWMRGTVGGEQILFRQASNSYTLATLTTSWQRVTLYVASSTVATFQIGVRQNIFGTINSTATVELWGAQLNEGTSALDYNPTTTVPNYLPRFESDPVTGQSKGLLIEAASTNLLQQSAAVRTSPWGQNALVAAGTSITAPDGTANGVELVWTSGTGIGIGYTSQEVTAAELAPYTISVYLKPKGVNVNTGLYIQAKAGATSLGYMTVSFVHTSGTMGAVTAGPFTVTSATSTPVGNGWYRVTVTGTSPATTTNIRFFIVNTNVGNGTDGVYAWGAQVEEQVFASSYIQTVASQVTRLMDLCSMTGTNFSSWYNQSEGTFVADFQTVFTNAATQPTCFILAMDGSTSKRVMYFAGSSQISSFDGSTIMSVPGLVGVPCKAASAYFATGRTLCAIGGTVATGTVAAGYSTSTVLNIGLSGNGQSLYRRVAYWPTRLSNAQLQSLTT